MTKKKYNSIRAVAILVFGVFMLGNGILLLFLAVYIPKSQEKHCTDYVIGEVVKVDGDSLRIRYELPGEGEVWNVSRSGAGWEKAMRSGFIIILMI